jgi:hypothetical protein
MGWDGGEATKIPVCDDYWNHLFLANEGLWDAWFCSGLVPEVRNGSVLVSQKTVVEKFFASDATTAKGDNGWESIAPYLFIKGQINVNSTSKEAWKALLFGLRDRPMAVMDAQDRQPDGYA